MKISPAKGSSTEMRCQHEASAVERKIYYSSQEKTKRNPSCFNMHTLLVLTLLSQSSSPLEKIKNCGELKIKLSCVNENDFK